MKTLVFTVATGFTLLAFASASYAEDPASPISTLSNVDPLEQAASSSLTEALAELVAVLSGSQQPATRRRAVERIVRQRLDFAEFSRVALADTRGEFTADQLDRYECEFDAYLSDYIGSRLVRYHQEQIRVFKATALASRDVILSTRISGGEFDQAVVTFLMRHYKRVNPTESSPNPALERPEGEVGSAPPPAAGWRAIDIAFEGTKVRKLLRAQFEAVLDEGGPDHLIAMLREKTPGDSGCATLEDDDSSDLVTPTLDSERLPQQNQPRE